MVAKHWDSSKPHSQVQTEVCKSIGKGKHFHLAIALDNQQTTYTEYEDQYHLIYLWDTTNSKWAKRQQAVKKPSNIAYNLWKICGQLLLYGCAEAVHEVTT